MSGEVCVCMPRRPEPPRTRRGLRIIACRLFSRRPHGGHRYIRGDETVVCPGVPS